MKEGVEMIEKAMIGYIDRSSNVIGVEPSWNLGGPENLGKFLIEKFPTKDDAIKLVNGGMVVIDGEPQTYNYVDGFGEVIENRVSLNKENYKPHIKHLYLWMRNEWHYSDNGIDWVPVREEIKEVA